jgi:hypothetical protein
MATLYWYGGSGYWSDYTNHWSNNSGNSPASPATAAPTVSDDVVFDSNSHSDSYICEIDANAYCLNLTLGNPSSGTLNLDGSSSYYCYIYGNLSAESGVDNTCRTRFLFMSTSGTKTLTTNGVHFGYVYFAGSGGNFQLLDDLYLSRENNDTNIILSSSSTFDSNGYAVILDGTYSSSTWYINGNFTFDDLTISPSSGFTINYLIFQSDITVDGTLTIAGSTINKRIIAFSSVQGTQRTITAAVVSLSNTDFVDIKGAGAGTWSGTSIGNGGGNTDITFTSSVTRYWVATAGGNWNATSSWSDSSGGSSGSSVPLCHDTVVFDSNSISSADKTIALNQYFVPSLDFSNITNSPTLSFSDNIRINGSLDLTGIGTYTQSSWSLSLYSRGAQTIKTNGKTLGTSSSYLNFGSPSGSYTFQDNVTAVYGIVAYYGTLDFNDKDVTCQRIFTYSTAALYMGNGTITLGSTSAATVWSSADSATSIYCESSTIKITSTGTGTQSFNGLNHTFNNIWITGSGNYQTNIYGSNTFKDFKVDTGPKTVKFAGSTSTNIETFTVSGTSGNLITIGSITSSTHKLSKTTAGTIQCNYLSISYSICDPVDTFYAGGTSTDGGNNTNWYFYNVPTSKSLSSSFDIAEDLKGSESKSLTSAEVINSSISNSPEKILDELESFSSAFSSLTEYEKTLSENINILTSNTKNSIKTSADLFSLIEDISLQYDLLLSNNSNVSLLDSSRLEKINNQTESINFQENNIKDISKNLSESLSLSAELLIISAFIKSFSSSLSLSELKDLKNTFYIEKTDSVSFSESAEFDRVRFFDLSSAFNFIESSIHLSELRKIEILNTIEQFEKTANSKLSLFTNISLAEMISKIFSAKKSDFVYFSEIETKEANKNKNEILTFYEEEQRISEFKRLLADSLFLTEYLSKSLNIECQDAFLLTESMIYESIFDKRLEEALDISEVKLFDLSKKINEILSLTEIISKSIESNKSFDFILNEIKSLRPNIKKTELMQFSEIINYIKQGELSLTEELTLEEVIKKTFSLNNQDSLIISESVSKRINKNQLSSFNIAEILLRESLIKISANFLLTEDLYKNIEVRSIEELLTLYEILIRKIDLKKNEILVLSETNVKNTEKTISSDISITSAVKKEFVIDIIDSTNIDDSMITQTTYIHPELETLLFDDSFSYVKSEKYLRKTYLLSKRGKSILLVRSD